MKKKDGLVLRDVCGEKVIVAEGLGAVDFGNMISLNETAAWLWEHSDENSDINSLAEVMCNEYDVEPEVAKRDIEAVINEWIKAGIAEG